MGDNARSSRQQFSARVRITVQGETDLSERFAANLSDGGMFIRDDRPPAVGAHVLLEFLLPDGQTLCRAAGKVVHARPSNVKGDRTAGMGIQFIQFDKTAKEVVKEFQQKTGSIPASSERIRTEEDLSIAASSPVDELTVGIDLGTTNSCIAIVENGKPRVIASTDGYDTLPSVVFISPEKKICVGHKALERMVLAPNRAIYGSKRFIGRAFESREVRTFGHFFHYQLAVGPKGMAAAMIDNVVYPLETLSAYILATLKRMAEARLRQHVKRCIITVPAYFGEAQRQAVREAGQAAGLEVVRLLSEPTAAAVAFGHGRGLSKTVLVYDLGGGTFDASILRIEGDKMTVLASDGDPFLGGSDFDDRITEYVLSWVERKHELKLRGDPITVQRVRFASELAKRQLSESNETSIDIPFFAKTATGQLDLHIELERTLLEALTEDLVNRTINIVESALKLANVTSQQIDEVVLVGGQSRMPLVAQRLVERFQKKPSRQVHPDHAVAIGAAIVANAAAIAQATAARATAGGSSSKIVPVSTVQLTDILPASIHIKAEGSAPITLLKRGTALPAETTVEIETHQQSKEFIASLYRGESATMEENESLGQIRMPSSFALVVSKTKASIIVKVTADGLLVVSMKHPLTEEVKQLKVTLKQATTTEDVPELTEDDFDSVE